MLKKYKRILILIMGLIAIGSIYGYKQSESVRIPVAKASGGGFVKSSQNPLIKEGDINWGALNADPVVIKDGDTYKMWLTGAGEADLQIGYATSNDGINWDVNPNPVFTKGGVDSWDEHGAETAFVLKDEGIYKMWYGGHKTESMIKMLAATLVGKNILPAIGYATSKDGTTWTRHGDKPVIGQAPVKWHGKTENFVAFTEPHVIKEDGIYKMWFTGNGEDDLYEIGYATSQNGIDWDLHPDNPVFRVGSKDSFESYGVFNPSVVKVENTYELWYGASPSADMEADYSKLKVYMARATSPDGIVWMRDSNNPIFSPETQGSGTWEEDGAFMQTVIIDEDKLKMWYVGIGRQGSWYPEATGAMQYQIGYAERKMNSE